MDNQDAGPDPAQASPATALIDRFFRDDEMVASVVISLDRALDGEPATVARRAVAELLDGDLFVGSGLDIALAAYELASNALQHGTPPCDLAVASNDRFTVVAAWDSAPTRPPQDHAPFHGLWLLGRMSGGAVHVVPTRDAGKWIAVALPAVGAGVDPPSAPPSS